MKRLRTVGQRLRRGLRTLVRWLAKMLQWLFKMLRWLFSSLPGMIAVWLVIGLIVPIVVLVCLDQPDVLAWLGLDGTEVEEEEPELQGIGRWERVLIAGGVVTLSAAIIGLVVSYRKQRDAEDTKSKTEFANAAAQLGDTSASVRIAGVYAMAAIADGSPKLRQQCIDVLCGHLRLPYDPDIGDSSQVTKASARHQSSAYHTDTYTFQQVPGEREVRFTIIRLIRDHLRHNKKTSWRGYDFDFTGAVFDGGDFSKAHFTGEHTLFTRTRFLNGTLSFEKAKFSGGKVSFDDAEFSGGQVSFSWADFSGGHVSFHKAQFSGGGVSFSVAQFSGGRVSFSLADFSGGRVSFSLADFSGGRVHFDRARFSGGRVHFDRARFSGGHVHFGGARFSGGRVHFDGAGFSGGRVTFDAIFSAGEVSFGDADPFTEGRCVFISGGYVDFRQSQFIGTDVLLDRANFLGGIVSFKQVTEWRVPPKLPDPVPEVLHLPAHLSDQ